MSCFFFTHSLAIMKDPPEQQSKVGFILMIHLWVLAAWLGVASLSGELACILYTVLACNLCIVVSASYTQSWPAIFVYCIVVVVLAVCILYTGNAPALGLMRGHLYCLSFSLSSSPCDDKMPTRLAKCHPSHLISLSLFPCGFS